MASKIVATATVRAMKHRKLLPTRAALSLVRFIDPFDGVFRAIRGLILSFIVHIYVFQQTPAAVNRIKQLLEGKNEFVSAWNEEFSSSGSDTRLVSRLAFGSEDVTVCPTRWITHQRKVRNDGANSTYPFHPDKMDEEVIQDGVKVLIDKKAQLSLLEMDYVETELSAEFVFNNPNIKGTCGCGESFSI
uniref:Iron-sulfur cluster assembly 1 homolog, mitochondrial n=1 Tax=Anopheles epiroticus TaxID=199890 RepID=A0A182PCK4_9DIPT